MDFTNFIIIIIICIIRTIICIIRAIICVIRVIVDIVRVIVDIVKILVNEYIRRILDSFVIVVQLIKVRSFTNLIISYISLVRIYYVIVTIN